MVKIVKRRVTKSEAELLIREIKKTPNIVGYSLAEWMAAEHIIVAENEEGKMLGVCLNYDFHEHWYKIAALFIFEGFRGQGIGKLLFYQSYKDAMERHKNVYTISANPIVLKMMKDLNFIFFESLLDLPKIVIQYQATFWWHSLIWSLNFYRIKEIIRKSIDISRNEPKTLTTSASNINCWRGLRVYKYFTNFVYGIHIFYKITSTSAGSFQD